MLRWASYWRDEIEELLRRHAWIFKREQEVKGDIKKQWDLIRDIYELEEPEIIEATKRGQMTDPYLIDWGFTPIEQNVWTDIRPRAPLYPQYPVLNYFIDFGNPYFKVGVEADGREYHQDKDRDRKRDERLYEAGWKIYRIPGWKTFPKHRHPREDEREHWEEGEYAQRMQDWYMNNSEGIINAIAQEHFSRHFNFPIDQNYFRFVIETLEEHVSVGPGCVNLLEDDDD